MATQQEHRPTLEEVQPLVMKLLPNCESVRTDLNGFRAECHICGIQQESGPPIRHTHDCVLAKLANAVGLKVNMRSGPAKVAPTGLFRPLNPDEVRKLFPGETVRMQFDKDHTQNLPHKQGDNVRCGHWPAGVHEVPAALKDNLANAAEVLG